MYKSYRDSTGLTRASTETGMDLWTLTLPAADTYLSGRVYDIIHVAGDVTNIHDVTYDMLDVDGCLKWDAITEILPEYTEDSYEYFIKCTEALRPCMKCAELQIDNLSMEEFKTRYKKYLSWTSLPQFVDKCLGLIKGEEETGPLQAVLFLTAIMERSLGNIYLHVSRPPCPSMIKDLLLTPELKDVFGEGVIRLLRVLIGPPISLNIRNVTWHGFPAPAEIFKHYPCLLLLILASLGKTLQVRGIKSSDIEQRDFTLFPQKEIMKGIYPELLPDHIPLLDELFSSSSVVPEVIRPTWKKALELYSQNPRGECAALLLPQLEHALRRVFAVVNNCEQRILTAENSVFFTTFDEMLDPCIGEDANRLREYLGDAFLTQLLDILLYPEGPRIRDRLSHGEVDFSNIPPEINSHVICICAALCLRFLEPGSRQLMEPLLSSIANISASYRSLFHPLNKLQQEVISSMDSVSAFNRIPKPQPGLLKTTTVWENHPEGDLVTLESFRCLQNLVPEEINTHLRYLQPFSDGDDLLTLMRGHHPMTLYRYGRSSNTVSDMVNEEELINLLRKVTMTTVKVSNQIRSVAETRFVQFESKQLRSRQRNTYVRMMDSIPPLSTGLRFVLLVVVTYFVQLSKSGSGLEKTQHVVLRRLRILLQYVENLLTFTNIDKNRWDESLQLTSSTYEKLCKV